jgi:toxin FitB
MIMPKGYLLDTNVVSETRRRRADRGVIEFIDATRTQRRFISVLTLGELRKGLATRRRSDPAAADALAVWVQTIETGFADRILPVDSAIAVLWGELSASRSLPVVDTLIAATALIHDLTLVTRNVRDMVSTGVDVLNPWHAD